MEVKVFPARTDRDAVVGRIGLRRVDSVRLTRRDGDVKAEAVGMGFRLPTSRTISLSLAAELIALGTPCVSRSGQPAAGSL